MQLIKSLFLFKRHISPVLKLIFAINIFSVISVMYFLDIVFSSFLEDLMCQILFATLVNLFKSNI